MSCTVNYYIINAKFNTIACLPSDTTNEGLQAVLDDEDNVPGCTWKVTQLRNEKYWIKSALCDHYAGNNYHRGYVSGEKMKTLWNITRTNRDPDMYSISDENGNCWGIDSDQDGTSIELCPGSNDRRFRWTFERPDDQQVIFNVNRRPIANLIRLFDSVHYEVQAAAARTMESIIDSESGAHITADGNGVAQLVVLLTSHDNSVQIAACGALRSVTKDFDHARASALDGNAVPPVVRLLSSNDIKMQEVAAGALRNITLHDPAQVVAFDENAIPGLIRLLSSNDNTVIIAACGALRNIMCNLDRARASALNSNAIPAVVRHLSSSDIKVQEVAAEALCNITVHDPARAVVVDENAIPGLVRLLSSNENAVIIAACVALKNITWTSDRARASALNANAIPAVVRHLSSSHIKVQEAAVGALCHITVYDPAKEVAVDENAIPGLVRLLSSNDNAVIIAACAVLMNMALMLKRARASALNANAIPPLNRLLSSGDIKVRELAAEALKRINGS